MEISTHDGARGGKQEEQKESRNQSGDASLGTFSLTEVKGNSGEEKRAGGREGGDGATGEDNEGFGLDDRFISEIMMSLDSEKIATLRRAFEQNDDDGLSLAEFVHVMTSILNMDHIMTDDQVRHTVC